MEKPIQFHLGSPHWWTLMYVTHDVRRKFRRQGHVSRRTIGNIYVVLAGGFSAFGLTFSNNTLSCTMAARLVRRTLPALQWNSSSCLLQQYTVKVWYHRTAAAVGIPSAVKHAAISSTRGVRCRARDLTTSAVDHDEAQVMLEHVRHPQNELSDDAMVSILTLNRPKAANAMGTVLLQELKACLSELEDKDSPTRCVVLTSSSPNVFSAGADLKERATMTIHQANEFVTDLRHTFERVAQLPMPVIAAIDGVAVGGGLELALAADFIVASSCRRANAAILGLPETSLAIVPGAGGTQRLARRIGVARAKQLIFTAARIDAATAHRYGLVTHLVDADDDDSASDNGAKMAARQEALNLAWTIAANGPVAIRAAKFAIDEGILAHDMMAALRIEQQAYERVLATRDRYEGLDAFRERRKPHYKGH
jgi:methylglutaconyl-CoA hydratase